MSKVSISAAWDDSKRVLTQDGRLLLAVALALFVLPGLVLDLAVPEAPAGQMPAAGPWIAVAVLAVLISLVGQLAVIRLAMGPHLTVGEAIAHGARRLPAYVASVLMWMLPFVAIASVLFSQVAADPAKPPPAAALGLLILLPLMLFVAIRLILGSAIASAEPIGPLAILRRSWALTRGSWWRLFGFFLTFMIGAVVLFWAVQAVFGSVVGLLSDGTSAHGIGWFVVRLVSQIVSALISVAFFVMLARIYVQLAARGEAQASVPSSGT